MLTMSMLSLNVPLSQWRSFEQEKRASAYGTSHNLGWNGLKNVEKLAQAVFSQLSHPETVLLVAKEFEDYPAEMRLRIRTLCQEGNGSGNVRKGVQRLNILMNGKLLREEKHVEHFQAKTRDGWKSKTVNPAVAGATRKYGIVKK